ncbi:hypothetical protein ACHHYP_07994 [Achlya hypogyna]|uniref:Transmembrane protein n=1 Tax=Achlya hypogyna TaxID=1202772 RepID=A0A1V9YQ38_ACHHY|nr:hypothetical protein ACHHYP_07994 [Achlya hypogyna]
MSAGVRPRPTRQTERRGWRHGDLHVEESHMDAPPSPVLPDAPSTVPRFYRVVTCAILFIVGTAALMYRNIELQNARDDRLLMEIQGSIAEMDDIAATAAKMEAHALRLASIAQSQLDAQVHQLDDGRLVTQQEKIRAEVESIHVETMQHMQHMMQAMVETTRKEALDMMLTMADDLARVTTETDGEATLDVLDEEKTSIDEAEADPSPAPQPSTVAPQPATTSRPSTQTPSSTVAQPSVTSFVDMFHLPHYWIFVSLCTLGISLFVGSCMQRRASITRYHMALQRSVHRMHLSLQAGLRSINNFFSGAVRGWRWVVEKKEQLSQAVYWSPTKGDPPLLDDEDDDYDEAEESVYFYPQTPSLERREQPPLDESTTQVHFDFDDDADEGLQAQTTYSALHRQSHYVNAADFNDLLTPPARSRRQGR